MPRQLPTRQSLTRPNSVKEQSTVRAIQCCCQTLSRLGQLTTGQHNDRVPPVISDGMYFGERATLQELMQTTRLPMAYALRGHTVVQRSRRAKQR